MAKKFPIVKEKYLIPAGKAVVWAVYAAAAGVFIFLLYRNILNAANLFYVPTTSWLVDMFKGQPWYFYFGRSMELSPFYIFSFLGFILPVIDREFFKENALLCIFSAVILMFFILWGNYQSRYLLPAIVPLVVLSVRMQFYLGEQINKIAEPRVRQRASVAFLFIIAYAALKTLSVDIVLTAPDVACYF